MERGGSSGSGSGNSGTGSPGNVAGNVAGSGRAAPPGGAGRALLCLALLLLPSPARTLPSPARTLPSPARHRLSRSRDLLEAANASLQRLKEFGSLGFECTLEEVDLEDITENQLNTIRACTAKDPGPGNCPVLESSTLDQGKCLQGISEDLRTYRAQLGNLQDPQLLLALDGMMEALGGNTTMGPEAPQGSGPSGPSGPSGSLGSLGPWGPLGSLGSWGSPGPWRGWAPFPARLRLCSVLQALRVRSVTISRVLSFLSSL